MQNFAPEVTHFMVVACELLIMDLTTRAWACAEESKRKGVQVGYSTNLP